MSEHLKNEKKNFNQQEYSRDYYEQNRAEIAEYKKENKDRINAYQREYRKRNREEINANRREQYRLDKLLNYV
jgi:hypothetical protein